MIGAPPGVRVWLACGRTDMRKGMDGLAMLVQQGLNEDPFGGAVFAFRGRRGQHATFYIQFAVCEDRLSLAPAVWSYAPGIALPAR
ncbi:MAG: IS66 family insertion sequence element accessory protein TnpB [Acetobacteraceae bacterium]|nr:IS66 family insertion sequence element accessory protein TnpB [Acetobacteraceae bacterium]